MPHLIDVQPVINTVEKIAAIIPDEAARERFGTLLASQMMSEDSCARPASAEEEARHRPVFCDPYAPPRFTFDPPKERILLARRHARLVRDGVRERDHLRNAGPNLPPRASMALRFAEEWSRKLGRMSYDALIEKAHYLAAERKARVRAEQDKKPLFAAHEIASADGRIWRRIVSVAELRRVGVDLHNCLAGANGQRHGYVRRLREDLMRFWALYDESGLARAALMADAGTGWVCEARAYRNGPFSLDGPDFAALVAAGVCARRPPPRRGDYDPFAASPLLHRPQRDLTGSALTFTSIELADMTQFFATPRRGVRTRA